MKVRLIRLPPTSQHKIGDIIESPYAWWLVTAGYAVPADGSHVDVDLVTAAHIRRTITEDYNDRLREIAQTQGRTRGRRT